MAGWFLVSPLPAYRPPLAVAGGGGGCVAEAPTGGAAVGHDASADFSWVAPVCTGGQSITDYDVRYSSNSGSSWTTYGHAASAGLSLSVAGLTNGTAYLFQVAAITSSGTGAWSASSSATPALPPAFLPIPTLTSNTSDGVADSSLDTGGGGSATGAPSLAWQAFDANPATRYESYLFNYPFFLSYAFPAGITSTINGYELDFEWSEWYAQFKAWTFEGSADGVSWTTLDTRSNWSYYNNNNPLHGSFALAAPATYRFFRWVVTQTDSAPYGVCFRAQLTA